MKEDGETYYSISTAIYVYMCFELSKKSCNYKVVGGGINLCTRLGGDGDEYCMTQKGGHRKELKRLTREKCSQFIIRSNIQGPLFTAFFFPITFITKLDKISRNFTPLRATPV